MFWAFRAQARGAHPSHAVGTSLRTIEDWVRRWRQPTTRVLQWIGVVLLSLVAMAEIDRLIAGSLGTAAPEHSNSAPLAGVIGPASFAVRDSWEIWLSNAATRGSVGGWIIASVALDAVFIVAYWWLVRSLIRARGTATRRLAHESRLKFLIWADVIEDVLLVIGAIVLLAATPTSDGSLPVPAIPLGEDSLLPGFVAFFALAKWILFALLLLGLCRDEQVRQVAKRVIRRLAQALWLHRLSTLLVAALFVVSTLPFDGVLDQLPDIQRQWIGPAWYHGLIAVLSIAVGSFAAFALGRARTRTFIDINVRQMTRYPAPRKTTLVWWLTPVATVVVLYVYAVLAAGAWSVGPAFWVFISLPVAALLLSLLPGAADPLPTRDDAIARAQYAWLTGDVVAVMLCITAGLGLVRSFTGPVFLGWFDSDQFTAGPWWASLGLGGIGVAVTLLAPLLLYLVTPAASASWLRWTDPRIPLIVPDPEQPLPKPKPDHKALRRWKRHRRRLVWFLGGGVAILLSFTLAPIWFATRLGAVAMTVFALTAWGAVLGAYTLALQDYLPLRAFRRMRLRATPVLTMAITIPLIAGVAFSEIEWDDPRLHAVRRDDSTVTSTEQGPPTTDAATHAARVGDITRALGERIDVIAEQGCTLKGTSAVPVVVFAAEGGGIRAAYWTTRVLEELQSSGGCFATSTLLTSSVSGGSVGVALAHSGAIGDDAQTALGGVASPDTVATGVTGLLVSDLIASVTGVRVPSWVHGEPGWRDRAALIELTWQSDVGELEDQADLDAHPLVGLPMMNSTDARTKCRVPVSTVPVAGDGERCAQPVGAPAATLSILDPCVATLDWASAAMLSARFPIITPAGRLGDAGANDACGTQTRQLIDGGYAEGSGLGTAADLAPLVAATVRERNATRADTYLVPILVFAQNSAGYDLADDLRAVSAEPLVPLVGAAAAGNQTTKSAWIQRISTAFTQACPAAAEVTASPPTDDATTTDSTEAEQDNADQEQAQRERAEACDAAVDAVQDALTGQVVVVAPTTKPTVVPPLGWALSSFSIASMERSLTDQTNGAGPDGVADLHDLLELAPKETPTAAPNEE